MLIAESDKRHNVRRLLKSRGRIELFDQLSSYDCTVLDISSTGAKLDVENAPLLPDHFIISVPSKGVRKRATVQWRMGSELGIDFSNSGDLDLLNRVAVLEEELKVMRDQIEWLLNARTI